MFLIHFTNFLPIFLANQTHHAKNQMISAINMYVLYIQQFITHEWININVPFFRQNLNHLHHPNQVKYNHGRSMHHQ